MSYDNSTYLNNSHFFIYRKFSKHQYPGFGAY